MESMHLSITPAPQGNTVLLSHGGDTTFPRGKFQAGDALEACLAGGRLTSHCFPCYTGGKEICIVESFFFSPPEQHIDILACSQKQLWFQLPCFKSNTGGLDLVGGREVEGAVIESKWTMCLSSLI
jgi:hypothetical protein